MKRVLACMVVMSMGCLVFAEQFSLKDPVSGAELGPFNYVHGGSVDILDYRFELQLPPKTGAVVAAEEWLKSITIPEIRLRAAPFAQAVSEVSDAIRRQTPNLKGFVVVGDSALTNGAVNDLGCVPEVTLQLTDVTALDAVRYLAEVARVRYVVEDGIVRFVPIDWPDGELITRRYPVQPGIMDVIVSREPEEDGEFVEMGGRATTQRGDVQAFFEKAGVPFPRGASASYKSAISCIEVRNTARNLDIIDRILNAPDVCITQVRIDVRMYDVMDPSVLRALDDGYSLFSERRDVLAGKIRLVSQSRVVTRSGVNAQVENMARVTGDGQTNDSDEASMARVEVGDRLNVVPTVGPDGYTIDLTLVWDSRRFVDWVAVPDDPARHKPLISERTTTTSVVLHDGELLALNLDAGAHDLGKEAKDGNHTPALVLVSVRLIEPSGRPRPRAAVEGPGP